MIGTPLLRRFCIWAAIVCLTGLLWLSGIPVGSASILRTADSAGAIVVQSRRTLRDQNRQSWQVIVFKRVQPDAANESVYLRLIGFPNQVEIAHPQPIALVGIGQAWTAADLSDQISAVPRSASVPLNVGQYALQSVLADLSTSQAVRLELPTVGQSIISLRIPPALVQEWQQVAASDANQLVGTCEQFPLEARQNSAFPEWTSCRIDGENR